MIHINDNHTRIDERTRCNYDQNLLSNYRTSPRHGEHIESLYTNSPEVPEKLLKHRQYGLLRQWLTFFPDTNLNERTDLHKGKYIWKPFLHQVVASKQAPLDLLRYLLQRPGLDIHSKDSHYQRAFFSVWRERLDMVMVLLQAGVRYQPNVWVTESKRNMIVSVRCIELMVTGADVSRVNKHSPLRHLPTEVIRKLHQLLIAPVHVVI